MAAPIAAMFIGGQAGPWRVDKIATVRGEALASVTSLRVVENGRSTPPDARTATWILRGTTGHLRYVEQPEKAALARVTPPLGRPEATRAAMIPIRKSDAWWELAQDERRAILEAKSQHIAVGMRYLPAIARRLYHGRELGEPFDFVTWFEYSPEHADAFEELVVALRATPEWSYVEREIDLRLSRQN